MKLQNTVGVAMSGGVDSAVAVYLLKKEYPVVFGASHYIWPDSACCAPAALERARDLCASFGIPYHVLDFSAEFSSLVVDDFIASYTGGMTPNPCVRCNERIRFSRFYRAVEALSREQGYCAGDESPRFATGHYVRIENVAGRLLLRRAVDRRKDQSYMLYRLPPDLLPAFIFPLGGMLKSDVVRIAEGFGFPVAETAESQDVCFIDGTYPDFIASRLDPEDFPGQGYIEDLNGMVLGRHRGYIHYTVGQRKGLGLSDGPWYVLGNDPERNRVIVGREEDLPGSVCTVTEPVWHIDPPEEDLRCTVMLRYNAPEVPCTVRNLPGGRLEVLPDIPAVVTGGQSAVFYRDDCVIGGGIIERKPL